ncbi:hypothetical protein ACFLZR_00215, partial [Candidatus Neomarinimicrobiota bacterium]
MYVGIVFTAKLILFDGVGNGNLRERLLSDIRLLTFWRKYTMVYQLNFYRSLPWLLCLVTTVAAHVQLDFPIGGETFEPGNVIIIEWHIVQEHDQLGWNLYYSPDGGITEQTIVTGLSKSQQSYAWIIPPNSTQAGKIRIVQVNDTAQDYSYTSGAFSIESSLAVRQVPDQVPDRFKLYPNYPNSFNPATTIHYETLVQADVKLVIFSLSGRMI